MISRKNVSPKNISSNQLFSNLFCKHVNFTEFLSCETKSQQFSHCDNVTCFHKKIVKPIYILKQNMYQSYGDFTELL